MYDYLWVPFGMSTSMPRSSLVPDIGSFSYLTFTCLEIRYDQGTRSAHPTPLITPLKHTGPH